MRISADDYHVHARRERRALGTTPLHPSANHIDILTQHLVHLRRGEAVLKPVYDHRTGTLGAPEYVRSSRYLVVEGLLNFHTEALRTAHDVRVYLAPPEELRRGWKLTRDCTRRGYNADEVLRELDMRERDAHHFIRPQQAHADIVVSFHPSHGNDPACLDADVLLRDTLPHPDLSPLLGDGSADGRGPLLVRRERDLLLRVPGDIRSEHAAELEEAVWARMSFANHLRVRRLGEFVVGTDLRRSDSLALVQVLVLYHLVWARATTTAEVRAPAEQRPVPGADSAVDA
ncbi:MAG: phosphoribulokinase [Solirubrobacteraceae bacterium]